MKAFTSVCTALFITVLSTAVQASFLNNGNGTVTDFSTSLMWQRCSAPAATSDCSASVPSPYTWDNALAYCNGLALGGHSDWRLPNVKELQSLLDVNKTTDPSIDTSYFPDTPADDYWSSTTFVGSTGMAWYVAFNTGIIMSSGNDKRQGLYIRCVRGG